MQVNQKREREKTQKHLVCWWKKSQTQTHNGIVCKTISNNNNNNHSKKEQAK